MNTLLRLLFQLAAKKNSRLDDVKIVIGMLTKRKAIFASVKFEFGIENPFVDQTDANDMYLPAYAAQQGNLPLVTYFIDDVRERSLERALYYAAKAGHKNVVEYLLPKCGLQSWTYPLPENGYDNPIAAAASGGFGEIVEIFLKALPPITPTRHIEISYYRPLYRALKEAISANHSELVDKLLRVVEKNGERADAFVGVSVDYPIFSTLLPTAIIKKTQPGIITSLLKRWSLLPCKKDQDQLPLEIAIREKNLVAVYLLLQHESDAAQLALISGEPLVKIFHDILINPNPDPLYFKIFCLLVLKGAPISNEFVYMLARHISERREAAVPYFIISLFSSPDLMALLDNDDHTLRHSVSNVFLNAIKQSRVELFIQLLKTQGFSYAEQIAFLDFVLNKNFKLKPKKIEELRTLKQELIEENKKCNSSQRVGLAHTPDKVTLDSYYDSVVVQQPNPTFREVTPVTMPSFKESRVTNDFSELLLHAITALL